MRARGLWLRQGVARAYSDDWRHRLEAQLRVTRVALLECQVLQRVGPHASEAQIAAALHEGAPSLLLEPSFGVDLSFGGSTGYSGGGFEGSRFSQSSRASCTSASRGEGSTSEGSNGLAKGSNALANGGGVANGSALANDGGGLSRISNSVEAEAMHAEFSATAAPAKEAAAVIPPRRVVLQQQVARAKTWGCACSAAPLSPRFAYSLSHTLHTPGARLCRLHAPHTPLRHLTVERCSLRLPFCARSSTSEMRSSYAESVELDEVRLAEQSSCCSEASYYSTASRASRTSRHTDGGFDGSSPVCGSGAARPGRHRPACTCLCVLLFVPRICTPMGALNAHILSATWAPRWQVASPKKHYSTTIERFSRAGSDGKMLNKETRKESLVSQLRRLFIGR